MLKKLRVKSKILGGYLIAVLLSAIVVIVAIVSMRNMLEKFDLVIQEYVSTVSDIKDARTNTNAIARYIRDMQMNPDAAATAAANSRIQELKAELANYLDLVKSGYTPNDTYGDEYIAAVNNWLLVADEITAQIMRGDSEGAAIRILNECTPALDNVAALAQQATASLVADQTAMVADTESFSRSVTLLVTLLLVAGAVFLIFLAILITHSVVRPLSEMQKAMVAMSQGDLKYPCTYEAKDEIGVTADALRSSQNTLSDIITDLDQTLNRMAKGDFTASLSSHFPGELVNIESSIGNLLSRLNDVMSRLRNAGDQVSAGAEQVSSGAQALAQGSTEQASAVEELSATINDISASSKQNADTALQARNLANEAGGAVEKSNVQMQEMLSAMQDISTSSGEISKIIKTIEDIAFQTNILALNAAVEAARAGAAGKGFAVVADEVRNLAAKSAEASKNTAVLIERTVSAVERGSSLASETASALDTAVSMAKEAVGDMAVVAQAINSEADAIAQITVGVDQISAVVQTNSATSEESAAASEELSSQAQIMDNLLSRFRLKGDAGGRAAVSVPAPSALPECTDDSSIASADSGASVFDKY